MDASTIGNTTVTVAVHTPREREPAILRSIYEHGEDIGFTPFYHKSNDFEFGLRRDFTEALIAEHPDHIFAFAHRQAHGENTDTQQVEAIHSAIHVHDRLATAAEPPLVIIDGNEQQARPFVKALSGLRHDLPVVAHCQQSEYYYPTSLLADLVSNYFVHRIEDNPSVAEESTLEIPWAKQIRSDDWGQAVSARYGSSVDYTPAALPARRGDTVREYINCWFQGAVAPHVGVDRPMSDSLRPVINALQRNGYEDLAAILEEL